MLAPTTSMPTLQNRPTNNPLAAIAGLLAGLSGGVDNLDKDRRERALQQQQLQQHQDALRQQAFQNDLAQKQFGLSQQEFAAKSANEATDNSRNDVSQLAALLNKQAPNTAIDPSVGVKIYSPTANDAMKTLQGDVTQVPGLANKGNQPVAALGGISAPAFDFSGPNEYKKAITPDQLTAQNVAQDALTKKTKADVYNKGVADGTIDPASRAGIIQAVDAGFNQGQIQEIITQFKKPAPNFQHSGILGPNGPMEGNYDPATGKWFDSNRQEINNPRPIPSAASVAANAPPFELKPNTSEYRMAQALSDGSVTLAEFNRTYSSNRPEMAAKRAAILDTAMQNNPNFIPAKFDLGFKFASNPKTVNSINAVNQVMPAIDQIMEISKSMPRFDEPMLNKALQAGQFAVGNQKISNVRQLQQIMGLELGRAFGAGSLDNMRQATGVNLADPTLSPENFVSNMGLVKNYLNQLKSTTIGAMGAYGSDTLNPVGVPLGGRATGAGGAGGAPERKVNKYGQTQEKQPDGSWIIVAGGH